MWIVTDEEFWALVGLLDGVADERSIARLTAALADRLEEFQRRLDEAIRGLDGSRFLMLPVHDVSDPDGAEPLPLMGDALENFLLAVVAAGPEVYQSVRADPAAATTRPWSFGEADRLARVYEEITGAAPDDPAAESEGWCRPVVFSNTGYWLPYAAAVYEIAAALHTRADWQTWWETSGRSRLDLIIDLADEDKGIVRRGTQVVKADFRLPAIRLLRRPPGVAARIAAEDVARILTLVAEKLALADPPPVPWPAGAEPEDPRSAQRAARLKELRARFPRAVPDGRR